MQPLINNPTFNAFLQIITALGMLASAVEPLVAKWPKVYAFVSRVAGAGGDVRKLFGGGTGSSGQAAIVAMANEGAKKTEVAEAAAKIAGGCLLAIALIGCTPTQQTIAKDATGAICELVIQDVEPNLANLPVCTTVEEVEQAIADWLSTHQAANLASGQLTPHERYLAVRAYQAKRGARR